MSVDKAVESEVDQKLIELQHHVKVISSSGYKIPSVPDDNSDITEQEQLNNFENVLEQQKNALLDIMEYMILYSLKFGLTHNQVEIGKFNECLTKLVCSPAFETYNDSKLKQYCKLEHEKAKSSPHLIIEQIINLAKNRDMQSVLELYKKSESQNTKLSTSYPEKLINLKIKQQNLSEQQISKLIYDSLGRDSIFIKGLDSMLRMDWNDYVLCEVLEYFESIFPDCIAPNFEKKVAGAILNVINSKRMSLLEEIEAVTNSGGNSGGNSATIWAISMGLVVTLVAGLMPRPKKL